MKNKYLFALLFIIATHYNSIGQKSKTSVANFGVGLRLGDPSGITLKKYMQGSALELSIGRSYMFYNRPHYYDRRFDHWYKDRYLDDPYYKDLHYSGYSPGFPLSMQLHYLLRKDVKGVDNLQWYWGAGLQFRYQKYYFDYQYKLDGRPGWQYARERVTDVDLGPDVVIGMEYTFSDVPLSLFGDINLFMELADDPFIFWFQGGVGVRYNF